MSRCSIPFASQPNAGEDFWPYLRDGTTLARPWAIPGTPGLEHRVGGLEKADGTGNIDAATAVGSRHIDARLSNSSISASIGNWAERCPADHAVFEAREQMLEFNVPVALALESMMVACTLPQR